MSDPTQIDTTQIDCSNCGAEININLAYMFVEYTTVAHGRGSKRVESTTIKNDVVTGDEYLYCWDAPCCTVGGEPYADSIEADSASMS
jgi:hypothetical protein